MVVRREEERCPWFRWLSRVCVECGHRFRHPTIQACPSTIPWGGGILNRVRDDAMSLMETAVAGASSPRHAQGHIQLIRTEPAVDADLREVTLGGQALGDDGAAAGNQGHVADALQKAWMRGTRAE